MLLASGHRLPDEAQQRVDDLYACPDFAYRRVDGNVAIFIDGPVHAHADVAARDQVARRRLKAAGWLVLVFDHATRHGWGDQIARRRSTFGEGNPQ